MIEYIKILDLDAQSLPLVPNFSGSIWSLRLLSAGYAIMCLAKSNRFAVTTEDQA